MKTNIKQAIINFFIPPKCPFCKKIITDQAYCTSCEESIKRLELQKTQQGIYAQVGAFKYLDKCVSCYEYAGLVRKGIINAKFKECKIFTKNLIHYIPFDLKLFMKENNIDIIISVPYHKSKMYYNEYDLPNEMAKKIANFTNLEYNFNLVKKIKKTANQHNLSKQKRQENLKGAFCVTGRLSGKNILIIDDVTTTGSTLEEVAKVLKKANAGKVIALTFAYDK